MDGNFEIGNAAPKGFKNSLPEVTSSPQDGIGPSKSKKEITGGESLIVLGEDRLVLKISQIPFYNIEEGYYDPNKPTLVFTEQMKELKAKLAELGLDIDCYPEADKGGFLNISSSQSAKGTRGFGIYGHADFPPYDPGKDKQVIGPTELKLFYSLAPDQYAERVSKLSEILSGRALTEDEIARLVKFRTDQIETAVKRYEASGYDPSLMREIIVNNLKQTGLEKDPYKGDYNGSNFPFEEALQFDLASFPERENTPEWLDEVRKRVEAVVGNKLDKVVNFHCGYIVRTNLGKLQILSDNGNFGPSGFFDLHDGVEELFFSRTGDGIELDPSFDHQIHQRCFLLYTGKGLVVIPVIAGALQEEKYVPGALDTVIKPEEMNELQERYKKALGLDYLYLLATTEATASLSEDMVWDRQLRDYYQKELRKGLADENLEQDEAMRGHIRRRLETEMQRR